MAEADHSRASRLLRGSHKQPGSSSVPAQSGRSLATHASAAQLFTWERMEKLVNDWLPKPQILHPWPSVRFAVKHPR